MKLKNIASAIASVAPGLATALGGPLAGAAVAAVSRALLGRENGTEEEVISAVSALTSEQKAELYKADIEFKKELARIDLRRDELVIEDRTGSRDREKAYLTAGKVDRRGDVLAFAAIGALIVTVFLAFFVELTHDQQLIVAGLIGSLTVIVKDVYGHHFGSSRGSEHKTDMIGGK